MKVDAEEEQELKRTRIYRVLVVVVSALSLLVNVNVAEAMECYKEFWAVYRCSSCEDTAKDSKMTDSAFCSGRHGRQYGVKLCTHCKNVKSNCASFYKRGYTDYNCLAYALGRNGVQSWVWEKNWGQIGPTLDEFKKYISKRGYKYTTDGNKATGKKIFYVYAQSGHVKHFARKYTLDGKKVSGAATLSKWGNGALYGTASTDPYNFDSGYGKLALICYK